jgi:hypothetical protein
MRRSLGSVARIGKRGREIFVAFPFEFFLGGFEIRNAHCDFFPLLSEVVLLFDHVRPCDSGPMLICGRDWGANWTRHCRIVIGIVRGG